MNSRESMYNINIEVIYLNKLGPSKHTYLPTETTHRMLAAVGGLSFLTSSYKIIAGTPPITSLLPCQ